VNFLSNRIVAALLWVLPFLLLGISVVLLRAGLEQREVAESGSRVVAEIIELETQERSEISRGHVRLRYSLEEGGAPIERNIELPMTYLKNIEARGLHEVNVRVLSDRGQIVLADHGRGQWIMTLSFAAMALIGALGMGWMVAGWNNYLARHGDPATSSVS